MHYTISRIAQLFLVTAVCVSPHSILGQAEPPKKHALPPLPSLPPQSYKDALGSDGKSELGNTSSSHHLSSRSEDTSTTPEESDPEEMVTPRDYFTPEASDSDGTTDATVTMSEVLRNQDNTNTTMQQLRSKTNNYQSASESTGGSEVSFMTVLREFNTKTQQEQQETAVTKQLHDDATLSQEKGSQSESTGLSTWVERKAQEAKKVATQERKKDLHASATATTIGLTETSETLSGTSSSVGFDEHNSISSSAPTELPSQSPPSNQTIHTRIARIRNAVWSKKGAIVATSTIAITSTVLFGYFLDQYLKIQNKSPK